MNNSAIASNSSEQNLKYQYSYHAVSFLDLLAQRKTFDDLPGIPETVEEKARLLDKLKHTIGYIRELREGFRNMFDVLETERGIPIEIPPQYHSEYRKLQKTEIHLQNFSDSFVAWVPIHFTDDLNMFKAINGVHSIMMVTATWNLLSLAAKHPLRGGIDVDCGIVIEPGGNEIYGRALNSAYELEQKAEGPRILIGPGLLKLLSSIESETENSHIINGAKALVKRCRSLIALDDDGKEILHFLGPASREIMCNQKYQNIGIEPAVTFVKESVINFMGDEKLGPRYKQLYSYFEKNISDWGVSM